MSLLLSRIVLVSLRRTCTKSFPIISIPEIACVKNKFSTFTNDSVNFVKRIAVKNYTTDTTCQPKPLESSTLPLKKKIIHKKAVLEDLTKKEGHYLTIAYSTAYSYDLKSLKDALIEQKLYEPGTLKAHDGGDVVIASAMYNLDSEPREIIFFKEGAVVFWNCSELEASNVLEFVQKHEIESYPREVVEKEKEIMTYVYQPNAKKCHLQESCFVLVPGRDNSLERYTFSHAMAQSARLGAWEAKLESLAASVRSHSRCMEAEGTVHVEKQEVVRKLGELFSLRHRLNVESDLLDTPDFYWEEEQLERLYMNTVAYFTIPRRTRVLNERLSHCVELLELLSAWTADRHHVRLEWFIIILILAEVCFELVHLATRNLPTTQQARRNVERLPVFNSDIEESIFQELSIVDT